MDDAKEMNKCVCCGDNMAKTIFRWQDEAGNAVRMNKCGNCGLLYQYPMQSEQDLRLLYNEEFFDAYKKYYLDFRRKQFEKDISRIGTLISPPGKLLDIGCAFGIFLQVAKEKGWDVYGVDVSKEAVDYAKKEYCLNVFLGTVRDAKLESGYFNVVTAWDVIEHLADPDNFLNEVSRIMKKGGILAIRTPNAEGLFLKINKLVNAVLGDHFARVGPKFLHHKYLFSVCSLKEILKNKGFEIIDIKMELENIIIVDNPSLLNYLKCFVKKLIKLSEFCCKKRRASILVYARKT
jgi:2-polyprenyl-3-methyl-5-hydroxy-6-metoxy-1,4-benzoquinol methylase